MINESYDVFANDHNTDYALLEGQLSSPELLSPYPKRALVQEQTLVNNHAERLAHYQQSHDPSEVRELSFDYN